MAELNQPIPGVEGWSLVSVCFAIAVGYLIIVTILVRLCDANKERKTAAHKPGDRFHQVQDKGLTLW